MAAASHRRFCVGPSQIAAAPQAAKTASVGITRRVCPLGLQQFFPGEVKGAPGSAEVTRSESVDFESAFAYTRDGSRRVLSESGLRMPDRHGGADADVRPQPCFHHRRSAHSRVSFRLLMSSFQLSDKEGNTLKAKRRRLQRKGNG